MKESIEDVSYRLLMITQRKKALENTFYVRWGSGSECQGVATDEIKELLLKEIKAEEDVIKEQMRRLLDV